MEHQTERYVSDYNRGYDLGADENHPAYYANGESDAFAEGFVDGRITLYDRIETDEGLTRDPASSFKVYDALSEGAGIWHVIRRIEEMEA